MRSSILHHLRILGIILSSPQTFPSLIDFFALVYSSDVNGPVLMFKSVKAGSVSSVSLLKLEELLRRPLKCLNQFLTQSAGVSPSNWPWQADQHPLTSFINFQQSPCLLLLWSFLILVTFSV